MVWMDNRWTIPSGAVSIYFLSLWIIPALVTSKIRPKAILFLWNTTLSIFSIVGFLSMAPFYFLVKNLGYLQHLIKNLFVIIRIIFMDMDGMEFFYWHLFFRNFRN
eukprot:UN03723